jgi:hypothetical protein
MQALFTLSLLLPPQYQLLEQNVQDVFPQICKRFMLTTYDCGYSLEISYLGKPSWTSRGLYVDIALRPLEIGFEGLETSNLLSDGPAIRESSRRVHNILTLQSFVFLQRTCFHKRLSTLCKTNLLLRQSI